VNALSTPAEQAAYWNGVVAGGSDRGGTPIWRRHSDQVNGALIARWLPAAPIDRVLKTDLFDEAVGDGLLRPLAAARVVVGIDLSSAAVAGALGRHARVRGLVGDVRRLPFRAASFDVVVSTSTLDHFERASEIGDALAEVQRVLRPGGTLVVTMDNTRNPVVALRSRIQTTLLRLGVVPYTTGASCDDGGLRRVLERTGFDVCAQAVVLHAPRAPAILAARAIDALGLPRLGGRFVRMLAAFERLGRSPVARRTGYFVAARAIKR
jgi:SAM-dependent methyltransferase